MRKPSTQTVARELPPPTPAHSADSGIVQDYDYEQYHDCYYYLIFNIMIIAKIIVIIIINIIIIIIIVIIIIIIIIIIN